MSMPNATHSYDGDLPARGTPSGASDECQQRVVAILGMHRSGTSALAGTLQECGLNLGDVNTAAPSNAKGNRESWLLMALHEDVLKRAGGSWDSPPPGPIVWTDLHIAVQRLYVEQFLGVPVWGFKDPRLLLLLEGWLEALPGLETVGVFRNPLETIESLRRRSPQKFTGDSALQLWVTYNRRLLEWHDHSGCPLVEFVSDRLKFNQAAVKIARKIGLPNAASAPELCFFEDALRHHQADPQGLAGKAADIYMALRVRASRFFES